MRKNEYLNIDINLYLVTRFRFYKTSLKFFFFKGNNFLKNAFLCLKF